MHAVRVVAREATQAGRVPPVADRPGNQPGNASRVVPEQEMVCADSFEAGLYNTLVLCKVYLLSPPRRIHRLHHRNITFKETGSQKVHKYADVARGVFVNDIGANFESTSGQWLPATVPDRVASSVLGREGTFAASQAPIIAIPGSP